MIPLEELRKHEIFADLDPAELKHLANMAEITLAREGEVLIRGGLPARTLYILQEGGLMVGFPDGRAITFHKTGSVVGLVGAGQPHSLYCIGDLPDGLHANRLFRQ